MMRRDDEIRLGGHFSRFGQGSREERRLPLREREALRRKAREAEYEDEEDEDDEDLDDDEDDDEEDEDEEDYDGDEDEEDDDDDDDEADDDEEDEDEDELDDDDLDDDEDDEDYDGGDDEDEDEDDDEEDGEDEDEDDGDEDSYEPSPAPSKPVSGSDDRDAFIAAYLAEKERELALEREATERAEKEERERQEREERARREEQARVQAEEEEQARQAEKAEIARRAREAEDRASRAEDRLGRTRAPFNGTEGYRGIIEDSLDRLSPVSGRSGGSQRESYAGREPVLSESDRALRERELALKEREIALKERELALREREQQLKSAGSHSGKSSSVSPASYMTRVINGKTVKVKDTGKKVSKPIEEPVALSQDNRSKRYEGLSDESLMKEVTAFMLRYGVKKHGIPYELMAEEFGAGLIAKLIIRGHLVRLGDSTLTCGNN